MIKLCVEKYCHTCPFFRAEIEEPDEVHFNEEGRPIAGDDYKVYCLHRDRCRHAVKESGKDEVSGTD